MSKANEFLKRHHQSADEIEVKTYLDLFIQEMQKGLNKQNCAVAMYPTYLYEPAQIAPKANQKHIVIDAGGTNFRSALGYFNNEGKVIFEDEQRTKMPASDRLLGREEFYAQIAANIQRLLPQGKDVGFCFSYPVEMQSDKDGVVKMFAKEIKAPKVVGTKVGQSTLQAVKTYSDVKRNIVILNDTVATLLGGIAVSKRQYGAYIGYIYGTGTNVCYMEHSEKIGKITDAEVGRRMLINTECGNFNLFPQGDYDKLVAHETAQPDKQMFEKMTSGKYLSRLMELCLQGAAADGEFAVPPHICPFELKDVTPFLQGEQGVLTAMFGCEQDAAFAREVCLTLIDRAAKLGAIANAAAAILSGMPNGLPIAIVAEGTTFRKLFGYAQKFTAYLQEILQPYGISFELLQGEELNMLGSLLAVSA